MALFSKVLQAVLETALPVLVSALAAWLIAKTREISARLKETNPDLHYILHSLSVAAVSAAEQLYQGSSRGSEKKEYAIQVVEAFLKQKNIDLDLKVIEAYIEDAVRDMNRYEKTSPRIDTGDTNENVPTTVQ